MKKIYYLSTCDTCKRIMKETGTQGFELRDVKDHPVLESELDDLHNKAGNYEALMNKRARKIREEGLQLDAMSEQELRALLLREYTLLKRPIYQIGNDIFIGNAAKTVDAIKARIQ